MTLSWETPTQLGNGRASEISYNVTWCTYNPSTKKVSNDCGSIPGVKGLSTIVGNLTPNTTYQFTITPLNFVGKGGGKTAFIRSTQLFDGKFSRLTYSDVLFSILLNHIPFNYLWWFVLYLEYL